MSKVLSQAGISLADVYDIEGSIAGTDELLSKEVSLVHEMGGQIHSERLLSFDINMAPAAQSQSAAFAVTAGGIPDSINRILGVQVSAANLEGGRLSHASLALVFSTGQEVPIWWWDSAIDSEFNIRFDRLGAGVANRVGFQPSFAFPQQLITRVGDAGLMPDIIFRGVTLAFGAGTIVPAALLVLLRPDRGAPAPGAASSHGLPIPSW